MLKVWIFLIHYNYICIYKVYINVSINMIFEIFIYLYYIECLLFWTFKLIIILYYTIHYFNIRLKSMVGFFITILPNEIVT